MLVTLYQGYLQFIVFSLVISGGRGLGLARSGRSFGGIAVILGLNKSADLMLAILFHEIDKVFHGARPSVFNRGIFATGRVKLNSRETRNSIRDIVGGGINLGNSDLRGKLGNIGIKGCKFLILGSKTNRVISDRWEINGLASESTYALQCPHHGA